MISRPIRYGLIAAGFQLPLFLFVSWLYLSKQEQAGHAYYAYQYLIGGFPWILIYRGPFFDVYDLLPRMSDSLQVTLDLSLTSFNWFLNGMSFYLVRTAFSKLKKGMARYTLFFVTTVILTWAISFSSIAVAFGFGDSDIYPTGFLKIVGYACGFIFMATSWPEQILGVKDAQGYLGMLITPALITGIFIFFDRRKTGKKV